MFGRRALLRFPAPARLTALTPLPCPPRHDLSARAFLLHQYRRSYATPGRPRKAVGEPSRPVKRAVRRSTAGTVPLEKATKQVVEVVKDGEKTAAKARTRKVKTEAAAAVGGGIAADGAETAAAKKPRAPRGPRKVLTEEEVAAKAEKLALQKDRVLVRRERRDAEEVAKHARLTKANARKLEQSRKEQLVQLKATALSPPKVTQPLPFNVYWREHFAEAGLTVTGPPEGTTQGERLGAHAKLVAAKWKELPAADIEVRG